MTAAILMLKIVGVALAAAGFTGAFIGGLTLQTDRWTRTLLIAPISLAVFCIALGILVRA